MISVRLELTGIDGMSQKSINDSVRKAMHSVGEEWHKKYLPKHFTHAGAQEYGYGARKGEPGSGKPEKGSYTGRKKKKFKHTLPLVYTGDGMREALSTQKIRATATSKKASVSVILPRVFNFRNPRSRTNPPEEITRLSNAEYSTLSKFFVDELEKEYGKGSVHKATFFRS